MLTSLLHKKNDKVAVSHNSELQGKANHIIKQTAEGESYKFAFIAISESLEG